MINFCCFKHLKKKTECVGGTESSVLERYQRFAPQKRANVQQALVMGIKLYPAKSKFESDLAESDRHQITLLRWSFLCTIFTKLTLLE